MPEAKLGADTSGQAEDLAGRGGLTHVLAVVGLIATVLALFLFARSGAGLVGPAEIRAIRRFPFYLSDGSGRLMSASALLQLMETANGQSRRSGQTWASAWR